ncbi:uncharacterized protein LOC126298112 [Schistocerca gregaria]|uniref:uncharacterized protein LOC126298112 n=1 Tax=Schistocerca gregaria TaxID=7010 RepID=UPI00211EBA7C|nr:uncharacterized protein LOC126298112 [Schistocerca gregaria]
MILQSFHSDCLQFANCLHFAENQTETSAQESRLGSNSNTSEANMTEKSKPGHMKHQSMTKFELAKRGPTQHTSKKTFLQHEHTTICPVEESEMIPMHQSLNSEETQQREPSTYSQLLSLHQLHNWVTGYEEANVNFYSPQLCHEIIKTKSNKVHTGIHSKYVKGEIIRCRVKHIGPNAMMIVATKNLLTNQPVIELKGKYMLPYELMSDKPTCSHSVNYETPRGPFIFSYEIPERGLFVCVDTRRYGNDARFVRRSCKPNAQIKHCFKQGMIHLYIVAIKGIERNCEITIAHEGMLPYACNQSCNISENISGSAVKMPKKTTDLGNDSGMMADSNYVTDGSSQQPIHPIPSCSVVQQMTVQVKNKKRKTSKAATRKQNLTKKPSQKRLNSTKGSRKQRSSFSRNGVTLVASSSINQPPTQGLASNVINNETQPHHDIAEMEQVMLNDHTQLQLRALRIPHEGPQIANCIHSSD